MYKSSLFKRNPFILHHIERNIPFSFVSSRPLELLSEQFQILLNRSAIEIRLFGSEKSGQAQKGRAKREKRRAIISKLSYPKNLPLQNTATLSCFSVLNQMKDVVDAQPPSKPSPIETVPPEILCEFFQVLAFENGIFMEFSESRRLKCYSSVFTLSQVCSLWRNISLSQPSLWSRLLFQADNDSRFAGKMIARDEAFLREVLQRSSNVTLCLTVKWVETFRGMQPAVMDALGVFAEHAPRYRVLTFYFRYFGVMKHTWEIFKSPANGRMPGITVFEQSEVIWKV